MTLRGDKNGRVTKKALFKTVALYECYIKDPNPNRYPNPNPHPHPHPHPHPNPSPNPSRNPSRNPRCYIKDQRRLDKLFDQFDTDRSNELDADELLPMLRLG